MNAIKIQSLIDAYKTEYLRVNGKEATVEKKGGWFYINNNPGPMRSDTLEWALMTLRLRPSFGTPLPIENKIQYFKLVPTAPDAIDPDEAYIMAIKSAPERIEFPPRPDWILNVDSGHVGVFNMENLLTKV